MNVLITGATGFIGRHLTAALSKNYSVRCLVRKTSDVQTLRGLNVDLVYGDLLAKNSLLFALDGIDLVFHLAGEVYSPRGTDYSNANILGTKNLLEASKQRNIKKIIYLSSVAVYKPAKDRELLTEESECGPITLYGKSKLAAETMVKQSNIPFIIVRAPVIYGPHQPPTINKFFLNALRKKRVYIIGDGQNLRSICYVKNLTDGLSLLIDNSKTDGRTYVLSDNTPYTFNQITATISRVSNRSVKIVYLPSVLAGISWQIYKLMGTIFNLYFVGLYGIKTMQLHLGCDIAKAEKEIAYNPSINLETGVKLTVEWIQTCSL